MTTPEPQFFDVVRIGDSDEARRLELNGAEGVVLGVSEDEATGEKWFLVRVGDMPSVMLSSSDLTPTGRSVPRESIYSGESVRVTQKGRIVGYNLDRPEPTEDESQSGPA
jgi:hypothetical protein